MGVCKRGSTLQNYGQTVSEDARIFPVTRFELTDGDKFAVLALGNIRLDLTAGWTGQLSDRTWILTKVPVEFGEDWKEWLGTVRTERVKRSNLVFVRSVAGT